MPIRPDEVGRVVGDLLGLLQEADKREPKCHPFHAWQHHFSKGLTIMRAYFDVGDQGAFHVVGPQVILEGSGGVYALCGKLISLNTMVPESGTAYQQHFELLLPNTKLARILSLEHDVCHGCASELTDAVGVMSYPGHVHDAADHAERERNCVLSRAQFDAWEKAKPTLPHTASDVIGSCWCGEELVHDGDGAFGCPTLYEPDAEPPPLPTDQQAIDDAHDAHIETDAPEPGEPGGSRSEPDA